MNLQELRTFLAIIETGSLVRASEMLNVTQSTVTARLKSLEEELGQTLITRNKSGARLTAAGDRLRRYADTITELWRQARQETALPRGMSGICNIACEPDLWPDLCARLVTHLTETEPDLALSVWMGSAAEVTGWLRDGRSDLAICSTPDTTARQSRITLPPDQLILVSDRPGSPMRFDPHYIFVEGGDLFGRAHAAAYADASTARISVSNALMGREQLLTCGGSAYLPERFVSGALSDGRLHPVVGAPIFSRPIYLKSNDRARAAWPWFDAAVEVMSSPSGDPAQNFM